MKNKDMSNAKQIACDTLAWRETLITMVETLSGAFFFIDDTETIVYANASAQALPIPRAAPVTNAIFPGTFTSSEF